MENSEQKNEQPQRKVELKQNAENETTTGSEFLDLAKTSAEILREDCKKDNHNGFLLISFGKNDKGKKMTGVHTQGYMPDITEAIANAIKDNNELRVLMVIALMAAKAAKENS